MASGAGRPFNISYVDILLGFTDDDTPLSIRFDQKRTSAHRPAMESGEWLEERDTA